MVPFSRYAHAEGMVHEDDEGAALGGGVFPGGDEGFQEGEQKGGEREGAQQEHEQVAPAEGAGAAGEGAADFLDGGEGEFFRKTAGQPVDEGRDGDEGQEQPEEMET